MSASKVDFVFDCIVERPRGAPFGGRFAIILAGLLLLIGLAATLPDRSGAPTLLASGATHDVKGL